MKVITFAQPDSERKLKIRRGRADRPTCYHRGAVEVDKQAREVTCGGCGTVLDPIEVLNWLASEQWTWDHLAASHKEAAYLLCWLTGQPGGRLVVTKSRAEAKAGDVVKTSSAQSMDGSGQLHQAIAAMRAVKGVFEWRDQTAAAKGKGQP